MRALSAAPSIRAALADDAAAIAALSEQLGYPGEVQATGARLAALPPASECVFVAVLAGQVVGWIQVGIVLAIESPPYVEIRGLVIDATHRGQGIGKALVQAGASWARTRGLAMLRVRSNVVRTATHAFYRQLGFTETKQQVVFVRREDT